MKTHDKTCLIAVSVISLGAFALTEALRAQPTVVAAAERTIASKRTKDVLIMLTNDYGKLTAGDNSFCVLFQKIGAREPADVQNVSVDFALFVGRSQEKPIAAQLAPDALGHYCGHVSLGRQYYSPASYYAVVHYVDLAGKKKKTRFFLLVK